MNWLIQEICLHAAKVIVSFLAGTIISPILTQYGITVNPNVMVGALTTLFSAGLTWLQKYLKDKFKLTWL